MATRQTNRQNFKGRSEYTGEFRPNTLPYKDTSAPLDAEERARLIKLTGTEDIEAPPDRRAWLGIAPYPESVIDFKD